MNRVSAGATLLLASMALVSGCGGTAEEQTAVPPRSYEMRGTVRRISVPGAEERQIWIHHEAIAEFVDIRGNSAPMDAMTMPFHLTESVDLSSVEPGDKVSFRLDVDWSASVPARIGHLEILPAETRLDFESGPADPSPDEPDEHRES